MAKKEINQNRNSDDDHFDKSENAHMKEKVMRNEEELFDLELRALQDNEKQLQDKIKEKKAFNEEIKKTVTNALHWFVEGYNDQDFDRLNDLLTASPEGPDATFIGTGPNEYKIGRDQIIEHWISEKHKRNANFRLVPVGEIKMGLHGSVVCLVTLLHLKDGVSTLVELRLSGYLIRQDKTWRWASIHLSTPDPTQGEDGVFPERRVNSTENVHFVSLSEFAPSYAVGAQSDSRELQLIITATRLERDAILQIIGPSQSGKILATVLDSEQEVFLGTFGRFPTMVTQCSEESGWEDSSEVTLYRVLNHWNPTAVAVLGRTVLNPQSLNHVGKYLIARELVRLGVRNNASGKRDYGGAEPLRQLDLDEILKRIGRGTDFDSQHVGKLVEFPLHAYLPIRRLKREIFNAHSDASGLLIEGASACLAAHRRGLKWLLVADIVDLDPNDGRQDDIWHSANQAAAILMEVSSGSEPWWQCMSIVDQTLTTVDQTLTTKSIQEFDVFLCHNSEDKDVIRDVATRVERDYRLRPWFDERQMRPGFSWMAQLEEALQHVRSVAVFVGANKIGPWQHSEVEVFLRECKEKRYPVIPVLLPTCPESPELPAFLKGHHWVDFRKRNPNPYVELIYGITGQRPNQGSRRRSQSASN